MKLKLDLHTHCWEATRYAPPSLDIARRIVNQIKEKGLDGIAITEHHSSKYSYTMKELIAQVAPEVIIIPGQEIDGPWKEQVVELFLPDGATFRFWAHPFRLDYTDLHYHIRGPVQGIEIDNPMHTWHLDRPAIREYAEKHNLLLFSNSDAHYVEDIGRFHNEIDLAELSRLGLNGNGLKSQDV